MLTVMEENNSPSQWSTTLIPLAHLFLITVNHVSLAYLHAHLLILMSLVTSIRSLSFLIFELCHVTHAISSSRLRLITIPEQYCFCQWNNTIPFWFTS